MGRLSSTEADLVRLCVERRVRRKAGEDLAPSGEAASGPAFLASGWACRQRLLADGRRQLVAILTPGDPIGFRMREDAPAQCRVVALTSVEIAPAAAAARAVQSGQAPGLATAIARVHRQENGRLLDHVVRLGRQTAYERVAHFLLELQQRLGACGLGDDRRFAMPLTQEVLADTLGLSVVHVNRTLQHLRRDGLIELRSGVAILVQPEALHGLADFQPAHQDLATSQPS